MQTTQLDHDLWDAVTEALAIARAAQGARAAPPVTRRTPREASATEGGARAR
jgi:hypothetical protein